MKNLFITIMLTAFCWSAFAVDLPRQDTTRRQQDTTRRQQDTTQRQHPKKSGPSKKKDKKKNPKRDTLNRRPVDTMTRKNQPM